MKFSIPLLVMIFLMSWEVPVQAELEVDSSIMSAEDWKIQEKARKRLYDGGRDEDDIKIMASASSARRKLNRREIEKEVFKQLFNEDLKESAETLESEADVEEE